MFSIHFFAVTKTGKGTVTNHRSEQWAIQQQTILILIIELMTKKIQPAMESFGGAVEPQSHPKKSAKGL